jgi:hypothetical protein
VPELVHGLSVPHLGWRDRFYLELRHRGWLSSKEQGDTIINYVVSRSLRSYYYDFNLGLAVSSCW